MAKLFALLSLVLCAVPAQAVEPAPVQEARAALEFTGHVVDSAGMIPDSSEPALASLLEQLKRETTDEVVIVTVESLEGVPPQVFAADLGSAWNLGKDDWGNGVVILLAMEEGELRISTGPGINGLLTNDRATQVVEQMLPVLREGRFEDGIRLGVEEVARLLRSDTVRPRPRDASGGT